MSINVTYQARDYDPSRVTSRYVRFDGENFRFCELASDPGFDIRQGIVDALDLPPEIRSKAVLAVGIYPPYVEWPL